MREFKWIELHWIELQPLASAATSSKRQKRLFRAQIHFCSSNKIKTQNATTFQFANQTTERKNELRFDSCNCESNSHTFWRSLCAFVFVLGSAFLAEPRTMFGFQISLRLRFYLFHAIWIGFRFAQAYRVLFARAEFAFRWCYRRSRVCRRFEDSRANCSRREPLLPANKATKAARKVRLPLAISANCWVPTRKANNAKRQMFVRRLLSGSSRNNLKIASQTLSSFDLTSRQNLSENKSQQTNNAATKVWWTQRKQITALFASRFLSLECFFLHKNASLKKESSNDDESKIDFEYRFFFVCHQISQTKNRKQSKFRRK